MNLQCEAWLKNFRDDIKRNLPAQDAETQDALTRCLLLVPRSHSALVKLRLKLAIRRADRLLAQQEKHVGKHTKYDENFDGVNSFAMSAIREARGYHQWALDAPRLAPERREALSAVKAVVGGTVWDVMSCMSAAAGIVGMMPHGRALHAYDAAAWALWSVQPSLYPAADSEARAAAAAAKSAAYSALAWPTISDKAAQRAAYRCEADDLIALLHEHRKL